MRNLILILGDQLDRESAALAAASKHEDRIVMIEARREFERVPSHKQRSALFLAAMRHHSGWLERQGYGVDYIRLDQPEAASLRSGLGAVIERRGPQRLLMVEAGEYAVQAEIDQACEQAGVAREVLPDRHFICSRLEFIRWRRQRRTLVMEHFYRHLRKQHGILMEGGQPTGGRWNFDQQNRKGFGRAGPGPVPRVPVYQTDPLTARVIQEVNRRFPTNPGSLDGLTWPVTREQSLDMLRRFISERLAAFGPYQDAMWRHESMLYHAGISAALNLKLLRPREVIDGAIDAYREGRAPIQSVEGFVRQILGWREYVRGIYWSEMPGYTESNALDAELALPDFYWTGETDMQCLHAVIRQTLAIGYAHHIQRLMVTGLFALLLGVKPQAVHRWYLAIYIDAVEWVEAPNTLGMSQYADGGLMASKPYAASGRYIQRMSNYCEECRYRPDRASGQTACPFTTLYWDFLMRHAARFTAHPRAGMQWRMLQRLSKGERSVIKQQASRIKQKFCA